MYIMQACVNMYNYISLFESGWERTTRFHGNSPLLSNFSLSLSVFRCPVSIFLSLSVSFFVYPTSLISYYYSSLAPSCTHTLSLSLSSCSPSLQLSATEENYSLSILEARHSPTVKPTFSFSVSFFSRRRIPWLKVSSRLLLSTTVFFSFSNDPTLRSMIFYHTLERIIEGAGNGPGEGPNTRSHCDYSTSIERDKLTLLDWFTSK